MKWSDAEAGKLREDVTQELAIRVGKCVSDFIDNETAVNLEEIRLALTAVFSGFVKRGKEQEAERKERAN